MSPNSNLKFTLDVDDFDSLITYANQSQWSTPDPSAAPDPTLDVWFDATYHRTNVTGAAFSFGFKGSQISLYGAAGPAFGSYQIDIDGCVETHSAHSTRNAAGYLLFNTDTLAYTEHTVKVTNLGPIRRGEGTDLLVDLVKTTVDIAPAGATLSNTTLEETDARLVYTGNWTENVFNPKFSGNFSRYTNGDGASVSLNFTGAALFIFGDKTDRHGLYTVTLDDRAPQLFNGVSGCGGAFAHACEKDNTLAYFAANLDKGEHRVEVKNIPGELGAYFDLDAIVITTPSEYLPAHGDVHVARAIGRRISMAGAGVHAPGANHLPYAFLLVFLAGVLLLGRSFRR
ncbi:hypothetical protein C8R45DRAFT_1039268 [Mycena sanguinolenta]|nr:hypothetical protein C8R45DRAFT_1039268 [Mycena sanguinolenta]